MRTDIHNNPTAFTTDIAAQTGLVSGRDYIKGNPFNIGNHTYYTAKLLGDPIDLTIKVIDHIGFYTIHGSQRWSYIGIPKFLWDALGLNSKRDVIGFMYQHEGGELMQNLFPNYGKT